MKKWLCVLTLNRDAKFTSHDMAYFIIGFWSALCTLPEYILYVSICHWARCVCSQYSMCSRCVMALRFELSLYSLHTDALSISSWNNAFWQTAVVHSSDKEKKKNRTKPKKKKQRMKTISLFVRRCADRIALVECWSPSSLLLFLFRFTLTLPILIIRYKFVWLCALCDVTDDTMYTQRGLFNKIVILMRELNNRSTIVEHDTTQLFTPVTD